MEHCMWTPGTNLAVITRNGVIVLENPANGLGAEFWTLLEEGVDLGTLLQALTSACGTNLAALPNFVAIVPEGDTMHIAVRGAFELSLDTHEGTSSFTSGNVITWEEKRVQQLNGWRINAPIGEEVLTLPQPTEFIAASAVIPVSTLSYGTLAATVDGQTSTAEQLIPGQTTSSGMSSMMPSIAPTAASSDELALAAPRIDETASELAPLRAALDDSEDPDSGAIETRSFDDTPEVINLPEVSAEERAGYTLSEDMMNLTRAYPEDDENEGDGESDHLNQGIGTATVADGHLVDEQGLSPVEPQQDFSDLFLEHTRARSVEEAAVRQVRNDDNPYSDPSNAAPEAPANVPTAVPEPAPFTAGESTDAVDEAAYAMPQGNIGYVPPAPPMSPAPPEPELPRQANGFFIDEVPRAHNSHAAATPSLIDNVPTPGAANHSGAPNSAASTPDEGFHDGHTVRSNKLSHLREHAQAIAQSTSAPETDAQAGPLVVACLCVHGHPNPTHVQVCRTCEGAMTEQTVNIPRPPLGTLHVSTGEVIILDRDVVIGRRPSYTPQPGRPHAHVVLVPSPNQEISRTHCEIKIDGWDVRIRDLGSNNGTFLLRPGQSPVRVTDSAPMILRPGDILDLGDAVTVRMEA